MTLHIGNRPPEPQAASRTDLRTDPKGAINRLVLWLLLLSVLTAPGRAKAEPLVADLSEHLIAITTGFTGTQVVLFGAVDQAGDVAVVVAGPRGEVLIRRKERVAGIWVNRRTVRFDQVPSFYSVATSRPLSGLAAAAILERHEIGLENLLFTTNKKLDPAELAAFRAALIRNKQQNGQFATQAGTVSFLGERLFRADVYFPASVPTGIYTVHVYLIRDGDVVSAQTTPLMVSKVGFSAETYDFAQDQALIYGILAVAGAVTAGWLGSAVFRRM